MLQVTTPDLTTWDTLLPEPARRLPDELARIDAYLEDERFIAPWRALFDQRLGRPSIPVPTLVRLLYLKHRYQLGYQTLVWEVGDSITWRRFARIPLDQPVPHPDHAGQAGRPRWPAGPGAAQRGAGGQARRRQAAAGPQAAHRHHRGRRRHRLPDRRRPAGTRHPQAGWAGRSDPGAWAATGTLFRDRGRAAGRRLHQLSQVLRRPGVAMDQIDQLTAQVARLARHSLRDAQAIAGAVRRVLGRRPGDGRLRRLASDLDATIGGTGRLLAQTAQRLAGQRTIADRMVSLADPDARPIRKGKPRSPTEFGYKLLVAEDDRGFVADHRLEQGNPPDAPQLLPAIRRVAAITGRVPATVAADRGFGTAANSRAIADLGVQRDGLHRTGRPSATRAAYQATRAFRRLRTWRVGIEARISHLKRGFGLGRTRLRHLSGARTWVGLGIFAYNLHRMTVVAAAA